MVSTRQRSPVRLREFQSVKRRLEVRAEIDGITIIDDFAHHPTAIAQTLKAAAYALCRATTVGDPRAAFEYAAAKRLSARTGAKPGGRRSVVLADVFKSEAIPENERLRSGRRRRRMLAKVSKPSAHCWPMPMRLWKQSHPNCRSGDVVADPFQWRLRRDLRETSARTRNPFTR